MKRILLILLTAVSIRGAAQGTEGDSLFSAPVVHTIKLYFTQPNWWDSLVAYKPLDIDLMCDIKIDGMYIDSIGAQFKGNSSYNGPGDKKPFNIHFDEYRTWQRYDGLKTINLNNCFGDPTLMREKIFLDFCAAAGVQGPRCTYVNLYLNDSLWGLYTLVEQANKTFLEDRYFNDGGNLFKGDPQGNLKWINNQDTSYYNKYELKTNTTANDWSDLVHLIDEINNTASANFYDSVQAVLNTDSWIRGWAACNLFVNLDSYMGSGHNYYIYHNTASNLFDYIIWDCNETFGKFSMGMSVSQLEMLSMFFIPSPAASRPLHDKMLQNTTYRSEYVNTICQYVSSFFTHSYFDPKIDSIANAIRPSVYADTHKSFTNQNFEDNINQTVMGNIPGLKSFITNRRNSLLAQLAANGCFVNVDEAPGLVQSVSVYPNPTTSSITLESGNGNPIQSVTVYNYDGREVKSINNLHSSICNIDLQSLSVGIYFLDCYTQNGSEKLKVVKY
jgi:spore coat protein CotH